jgi:hypothetical protein
MSPRLRATAALLALVTCSGHATSPARLGAGVRAATARRSGLVRSVTTEPPPAAPLRKKWRSGPRQFPLSAIVGQSNVKTALLLASINPYIGGVVIAGSRGTAKSVMARAAHALMPPIEVVKGSAYNIDPAAPPGELDSFLEKELRANGKSLSELETEVIDVPFCQVCGCCGAPSAAGRRRAPARPAGARDAPTRATAASRSRPRARG